MEQTIEGDKDILVALKEARKPTQPRMRSELERLRKQGVAYTIQATIN